MPKPYIVNGVPRSIAIDAWWFAGDADNNGPSEPRDNSIINHIDHWGKGIGLFVLLLLLGDFLFWHARPGFTLAIYAMAIFGAAVASRTVQVDIVKPSLLLFASALPVIEHVQLLSVCILVTGGFGALGWLKVSQNSGIGWIAAATVALLRFIPFSGLWALLASVQFLRRQSASKGVYQGLSTGALWRNWAFPVGGAMILGSLLISANPVLQQFAVDILAFEENVLPSFQRVLFCLGLMLWPMINPPEPDRPFYMFGQVNFINIGLNDGSVLRALIIFNAFLLVQSILDISILLAGADLPGDMSYATYAHRGAYPLLVTAMLAGAFTFAARPFLDQNRLIKPLLVLWVAQNVLLTLSSVLRLDLYISEYGLTYLRIYALIWMALVAIGLVIVLWHVYRAKSSFLLLTRLAILGGGTLYLCAFVNFAGIIATHTMARAAQPEHARSIDWAYICSLRPTANKAIAQGLEIMHPVDAQLALQSCHPQKTIHADWREWDFRTHRTRGQIVK